jgi:hypothetical protein
MEKLSSNLSLKEVIKSNTAKRKGIDNSPTAEHLANLKVVAVRVFQPIREHFATPIGISSGYRSEALNKAIGGSKTSQHSRGQALDLDADIYGGLTNFDIFFFIKNNIDFDQLIWEFGTDEEPNWVHVSFRADGQNRKSVLKAIKSNGRTKYLKIQ